MKNVIYLLLMVLICCCSSKEETSEQLSDVTIFREEDSNSNLPSDSNNSQNPATGSDEAQQNSFPNGDSKVLFLGNSLTYFNDLPGLVEEAAAKNGYLVNAEMLAKPNYAILDHWDEGEVQQMIANGAYDYLVIQQGPSSQEWGREVLFEYGVKYNALCSANGVKLVYFMVWPSRAYYYTFPGVIKNYREASINTSSILCPVGEVWKNHFDSSGNFSYYGSDGFHPSLEGSIVAAQVITNKLFPKSPKG